MLRSHNRSERVLNLDLDSKQSYLSISFVSNVRKKPLALFLANLLTWFVGSFGATVITHIRTSWFVIPHFLRVTNKYKIEVHISRSTIKSSKEDVAICPMWGGTTISHLLPFICNLLLILLEVWNIHCTLGRILIENLVI